MSEIEKFEKKIQDIGKKKIVSTIQSTFEAGVLEMANSISNLFPKNISKPNQITKDIDEWENNLIAKRV